MQWRTPKPGRAIDRKAPLWPVAAVMSAVLAGVGVVVAQQFIAGPVFRAAVCFAPRNDSDTRIADGIIIASVVAVAAVGATRTKSGLAVMTVLLAIGPVVAVTVCAASIALSVLFATTFAVAQSAVG